MLGPLPKERVFLFSHLSPILHALNGLLSSRLTSLTRVFPYLSRHPTGVVFYISIYLMRHQRQENLSNRQRRILSIKRSGTFLRKIPKSHYYLVSYHHRLLQKYSFAPFCLLGDIHAAVVKP